MTNILEKPFFEFSLNCGSPIHAFENENKLAQLNLTSLVLTSRAAVTCCTMVWKLCMLLIGTPSCRLISLTHFVTLFCTSIQPKITAQKYVLKEDHNFLHQLCVRASDNNFVLATQEMKTIYVTINPMNIHAISFLAL